MTRFSALLNENDVRRYWDCRATRADLRLAEKALAQRLENATKYSPRDEPITITDQLNGKFVATRLVDRSYGIDETEQALGIGLLSGGYGQDELERAGAFRVYQDPRDLLNHLGEVGVRITP